MAQNKNSKKSQGICKKIRNITLSPFISRNKSSITISQNIPIDYNHFSSQNSKKLMREKENNLGNEREKVIGISSSSNAGLAKANDDDDSINHEGKFSDYINKTKNRLMKTLSTVGGGGGDGGGGGGGISSRRDSFNDKVTNYINRAKIKIRTTSNVVDK